MTQGSAHGLVVIHGHSENQKQDLGSQAFPQPGWGFATGFPFPRLPEGEGGRLRDQTISSLHFHCFEDTVQQIRFSL